MESFRPTKSMPLIITGMICIVLLLFTFEAVALFNYSPETFNSRLLLAISLVGLSLLGGTLLTINHAFKYYQKQTTAELATDQLTGFMSRHVFGQVFSQVIADAKRSKLPLSVILIDIDRFRLINEAHNHKIGDLLLTKLGATIQETLRESDMTCRWDGDEFLVVLRDCGATDAEKVSSKILANIRALRIGPKDKPVPFSVSMGVAQLGSKDSLEVLVDRALTGLYSARDNGRNTFAIGYDWVLIDYYFKPIL